MRGGGARAIEHVERLRVELRERWTRVTGSS